MPFHSIAILQAWVDEFVRLGHPVGGGIRVIPQDGAEGADTGLVAMRITNSPTEIYIQPPDAGEVEWTIMFEAREEPVRLRSSQLQEMAGEIATLATLCAFLQAKSDGYDSGLGR